MIVSIFTNFKIVLIDLDSKLVCCDFSWSHYKYWTGTDTWHICLIQILFGVRVGKSCIFHQFFQTIEIPGMYSANTGDTVIIIIGICERHTRVWNSKWRNKIFTWCSRFQCQTFRWYCDVKINILTFSEPLRSFIYVGQHFVTSITANTWFWRLLIVLSLFANLVRFPQLKHFPTLRC